MPGLATYTRLKVDRETGSNYLHCTEVGMQATIYEGSKYVLYLHCTEVGTKVGDHKLKIYMKEDLAV